MESKPVPEEKQPAFDPQSGKIEPAPIDIEGARVLANEAGEDLEEATPLDQTDVRQLAENYVTSRGADDTDNFKDYAERRASSASRSQSDQGQ